MISGILFKWPPNFLTTNACRKFGGNLADILIYRPKTARRSVYFPATRYFLFTAGSLSRITPQRLAECYWKKPHNFGTTFRLRLFKFYAQLKVRFFCSQPLNNPTISAAQTLSNSRSDWHLEGIFWLDFWHFHIRQMWCMTGLKQYSNLLYPPFFLFLLSFFHLDKLEKLGHRPSKQHWNRTIYNSMILDTRKSRYPDIV